MPSLQEITNDPKFLALSGDNQVSILKTIVNQKTPEQMMQGMAMEVGPVKAAVIGAGRGFMNVARGVGLVDPAGPEETAGYEALKKERPYTTGAGEIAGEAAPFLIPGTGVGKIASTGARIGTAGLLGATEGGIVARGNNQNALSGAGIGGSIGVAAEVLFPVVGKIAKKIYQKIFNKLPAGAMLDASGKPTAELSEALQQAGISFESLTEKANNVIKSAEPGTDPEQLARKVLFESEGITPSTGDVIGTDLARAPEQEMIQTVTPSTQPLRDAKLTQSEQIKANLGTPFGETDPTQLNALSEETGGLVQNALSGRKSGIRSSKNKLYTKAGEASKEIGGVPIPHDKISPVIPDASLMEDLAIQNEGSIASLDKLLTKYGLKEPTDKMVEAGFEATPLTVENAERFRKTLGGIARGDNTGAAGVATKPIIKALDSAMDDVDSIVSGVKKATDPAKIKEIGTTLKEARGKVIQLKKEFSPQSIIGQVIDTKKDGVTQVTKASQVYNKLVAKSQPVENTRLVMESLAKSPKGEQAVASLQATTMLDLINAGFTTNSRKVGQDIVFNPIAFKNRIKQISPEKLSAIFGNNPEVLKKINNIDKIAAALVPPDSTVLKGSASILSKLSDNLGFGLITAKFPPLALVKGALSATSEPIKTGYAVKQAAKGAADIKDLKPLLEKQFPGIFSALAIPTVSKVNSLSKDKKSKNALNRGN